MKTNLNKKTIAEFKTLTKMKKDGKVVVTILDNGCYEAKRFDMANELKEHDIHITLAPIVQQYDARNWNTTAPVEEVVETIVEASENNEVAVYPFVKDVVVTQITIDKPSKVAVQDQESFEVEYEVEGHRMAEFIAENSEDFIVQNHIAINITEGCYVDLRDKDSDEVYYTTKSDAFRALSEAGMSAAKIAKLFGAHYSYVYGVLKRNNSLVPSTSDNTFKKKDIIISLFEKGTKTREIAEQLNTHISYVRTTIAKHKKGGK